MIANRFAPPPLKRWATVPKAGNGEIRFYFKNSGNIQAGTDTYGAPFSRTLKADEIESQAPITDQFNVTTNPMYKDLEESRDYEDIARSGLYDGRMKGKEVNHDTAPWYAYSLVKAAIEFEEILG